MKKYILFLAFALIAVNVFGQANPAPTGPRWGPSPSNDNTGRVTSYSVTTFTMPSNDSLKVRNSAAFAYAQETDTLNHALLVLNFNKYTNATSNNLTGDREIFQFSAGAITAGRVVTFGNGYATSGTLTVTTNETATISFILDNTGIWRETSRVVE